VCLNDQKKAEKTMSTISGAAAVYRNASCELFGTAIGSLKQAWDAYHAWRFRKVTIASLESLSDRQLEDIGLTRGQVYRSVHGVINVGADIARGF
jgi:uncharacterized protein YjiS (DUF1127 family)